MIKEEDGVLMYFGWGKHIPISKSFHNEDSEQNIKDANDYMSKHPYEGVIYSKDNHKSIYLAYV